MSRKFLTNFGYKQNAFTLIELLVVIAIVGILSGLIIVGMSSSIRSANIARGQIFSSSLRDSLLNNLISEWKLDETSGSTAYDYWNNNNCAWSGPAGANTTAPNWRPSAECVYNGCLNFDGTDDVLNCNNPNNLNIANALTIEAWVNLQSSTGFQAIVDKGWFGGYSILVNNTRNIYGYYSGGSSPTYYTVSAPASSFNWGEWTHIAYVYTTALTKLYVNGIEKASKVPEGNITLNSVNVKIGGDSSGGNYYIKGLVDSVRIYNSAIPMSQIRENYYLGMIRLLAKGEMSMGNLHEFLNVD